MSTLSRLRCRLGMWLVGGDLLRAFMALWLIRERALRAITEDGRVSLADCEPLAEALYRQVPGEWSFTISRLVSTSGDGQ